MKFTIILLPILIYSSISSANLFENEAYDKAYNTSMFNEEKKSAKEVNKATDLVKTMEEDVLKRLKSEELVFCKTKDPIEDCLEEYNRYTERVCTGGINPALFDKRTLEQIEKDRKEAREKYDKKQAKLLKEDKACLANRSSCKNPDSATVASTTEIIKVIGSFGFENYIRNQKRILDGRITLDACSRNLVDEYLFREKKKWFSDCDFTLDFTKECPFIPYTEEEK